RHALSYVERLRGLVAIARPGCLAGARKEEVDDLMYLVDATLHRDRLLLRGDDLEVECFEIVHIPGVGQVANDRHVVHLSSHNYWPTEPVHVPTRSASVFPSTKHSASLVSR